MLFTNVAFLDQLSVTEKKCFRNKIWNVWAYCKNIGFGKFVGAPLKIDREITDGILSSERNEGSSINGVTQFS